MKKKVLSALLSVAMVATLLVGCGGSKEEAAAPAPEATTEAPAEEEAAAPEATGEALHFEIVSKGLQHEYWQAVKNGCESKAQELGATINFVGPASESDIQPQVDMLNAAVEANPTAIGLAALSTEACMDAIIEAQNQNIPIVGFDSGVPGAPEGSILANAATDNYNAGVMAAEEVFKLIEDKLAAGAVIGVMCQDATGESLINRGLGFIDKMAELVAAKGLTVTVQGNDKYVSDSKVEVTEGADVTLEVKVPASVDNTASANDATALLQTPGIIAIYGSNEFSANNLVTADGNINKLGKEVVGAGFDSGETIIAAVRDGRLAGAITQAPVAMGEKLIEMLYAAANGETVADVDTGCQWYNAENIDNPEICQNLYGYTAAE